MAAGLGFKDFTTGEVLTAADVDGYLMQGIWVFASAAARDAAVTSPQEGNFAYLKDTNTTTYYTGSAWTNLDTTGMVNPMTTTGDTIYSSSGSTPARLGIGSTGQVLTVAGGVPTWAAPAGGGKVLQVLNFTTTTSTGATTTTFVDTAVTLAITPTLATSKILCLIDMDLQKDNNNGSLGTRLLRDTTTIATIATQAGFTNNSDYNNIGSSSLTFLDSPATTSATTYKVQMNAGTGTGGSNNAGGGRSSITLMEIGV